MGQRALHFRLKGRRRDYLIWLFLCVLLSLKVSLHFSTMGLVTILCVLSEVDADTRHAPKSAPKSFKKTVEDASLLVYFQIDFLSSSSLTFFWWDSQWKYIWTVGSICDVTWFVYFRHRFSTDRKDDPQHTKPPKGNHVWKRPYWESVLQLHWLLASYQIRARQFLKITSQSSMYCTQRELMVMVSLGGRFPLFSLPGTEGGEPQLEFRPRIQMHSGQNSFSFYDSLEKVSHKNPLLLELMNWVKCAKLIKRFYEERPLICSQKPYVCPIKRQMAQSLL